MESKFQDITFLSFRTQQIVCGGCYSSSAEVISSVPQGVLGSLLFLIYINILNQMISTCCLYADDVYCIGKLKLVLTQLPYTKCFINP